MYKLLTIILMVLLSISGFTQEINNAQKQFIKTSLISNGGFENGKTGWVTYKDTAQALPVDGVGGSPTLTLGTTTSSPLAGRASGLITHGASNQQGEGASYPFFIDSLMQSKVINVSGSYTLLSGTYSGGTSSTDSDIVVYIYDVTNGTVIQPTGYKLDGAVIGQKYDFNVSFQSASNSTSYRLIFHNATSTTNAFTMKFEVTDVSKQPTVQGAIETAIVNMGTITIGATTTAPTKGTIVTDRIMGQRKGQRLIAEYQYKQSSLGTAGSGNYLVSLPSGMSFDSAIITPTTNPSYTASDKEKAFVGYGSIYYSSGEPSGTCSLYAYDLTRFQAWCTTSATGFSVASHGWDSTNVPLNASTGFSFKIDAPILGWGSSQLLSSDSSSRVVAFSASTLSSTSITSGTAVSFVTKNFDTHGTFNLTSYTIPESGYYKFSAGSYTTASGGVVFRIFKNGSAIQADSNLFVATATNFGNGTRLFYCNANDVITLVPDTTLTLGATSYSFFSAEKVQGPQQIGASELVSASYRASANVSCSTSQPTNFDTKEFDSHGAVTTGSGWKFTAPIAGLYQLSGYFYLSNVATGWVLYKNGVSYKFITYTTGTNVSGHTTVRLNAGDYIDLRSTTTGTCVGGALDGSNTNIINISRIGL